MSKCKNPVQSKGDFKSWCMVNLHSQFLKKRRKKKNHVISKVTPKVCMLFKTALYDGSWDKRDETVLNTLLTRCWLKKKKKKKETNRKIMNQKRSPFQASMTLGWTFEWYCHSSADTWKESIFLPIYNMIHQGRNLP